MTETGSLLGAERKAILAHRTVWRWHFYAGLFCIPFVIILSLTGAAYLFKPQVEAILDRPYDGLVVEGGPQSAQAQRTPIAPAPSNPPPQPTWPRTELATH